MAMMVTAVTAVTATGRERAGRDGARRVVSRATGWLAAAALAGAALLGATAATAQATMAAPKTFAGPGGEVAYLNGGIGFDEATAMRAAARDWPMRLVFASGPDGAFVADVDVKVVDAKGAAVFALPAAGPITLVRLPPGAYKVSATFKGATQTRDVRLAAKGGQEVKFAWPAGN